MDGRRDPVVAAARIVGAIRDLARCPDPVHGQRWDGWNLVPGGTNVFASAVDFWLDVRYPDDAVTAARSNGSTTQDW